MMDDPEVTIEPADNGYIVRHYQRSTKKDEGGRTIRRVASTADEALGHAGKVLGAKNPKKKSARGEGGSLGEDYAVPSAGPSSRGRARRRRARVGGRR